jgi:hypothetical protein
MSMTKITAPRVRQTNLYTVESNGQPVAQAEAISQAEAVALWVASQQQPTLAARLSTPREARALAHLPLLSRGAAAAPARDPRVPDLFEDAPAVADHVEDVLAMVPEVAAEAEFSDGLSEQQAEAVCAEVLRGLGDGRAAGSERPHPVSSESKGSGKVPVKYRDPSTGSTWSGRGLKPRWLFEALEAGRTQDEFLIDPA